MCARRPEKEEKDPLRRLGTGPWTVSVWNEGDAPDGANRSHRTDPSRNVVVAVVAVVVVAVVVVAAQDILGVAVAALKGVRRKRTDSSMEFG